MAQPLGSSIGWLSTGATPKTISVCDSACAALRADPAGRVDVLLGCKTVIIVD